MERDKGIDGASIMFIAYDLGSQCLHVEPVCDRSAGLTCDAPRAFMLDCIPKRICNDGAPEFIRAAKDLEWRVHDMLNPGDPQGNGLIESCADKDCAWN